MKLRTIIKFIFYPLVVLRRRYIQIRNARWAEENPKALANYLYKNAMGHDIRWDAPEDLNEKINWLKFNSDTSKWTICADKYLVREYVENRGLGHILPKLYGVWERSSDIDFSKLPNKFVLKSNHACATVLLVEDKSKLNIPQTCQKMDEWLKIRWGKSTVEPHYLGITPLLIAEEYLQSADMCRLVDYKLFMINGKLELVLVCSDREIGVGCKISIYDKNWKFCPEKLAGNHSSDSVSPIVKPKTFEEMIRSAELLSSEFPQVRVDFYEIDGKLFFGELTFTSLGGYMNYIVEEELLRLGKLLKLPNPIEK